MEFVIVSGLSGAGKTRTADMLEDLGFYCVDNMPVALLTRFAQLCLAAGGRYERVALVTDIRERESFSELFSALDELTDMGCDYKILFVEADTDVIVKRYKESRRRHPIAVGGSSLQEDVERERRLLSDVRARADFIVNTSSYPLSQLQSEIYRLFSVGGEERSLSISVMSFGFKHGLPLDADLVFDVRCLPNPYYNEALRPMCGLDPEVSEFIFSFDTSRVFLEKTGSLIDFLLPLYVEEGKQHLVIAVGCTGGRHRSVAVAEALAAHLRESGRGVVTFHRDLDKN